MIVRSEHADGFTVINNDLLRDFRLTDGAVRLLVFMLSMSDDWNFSTRSLASQFGVSESAIVSRVTELKRYGYIKTQKNTDRRGCFTSCTWVISEQPQEPPRSDLSAYGENRIRRKPHAEKTAFGKTRTIRNNNSKEIPNIKEITIDKKGASKFVKPTLDEIAAYCKERGNKVDPQKFLDHYEANGWRVGKNPMKDWRASVRTWERSEYDAPKRSRRAKWRTGGEAGIVTTDETRAPVSNISNNNTSIPDDILDLFGN